MMDEGAFEILVRGPNWLGDLVMATPGLRSLRAGFPEARITLQLRPGLEDLLRGSPFVDQIESLDSYHEGPVALASEARRWRKRHRFDLGICLPDSFSSVFFMKLAGVRKVVGYTHPGRGLLLDEAVIPLARQQQKKWVSREEHALGLMRILDCPDLGTHLSLPVSNLERSDLAQVLESNGVLSGHSPLVVLAPGASYGSSKRWPIAHFSAVGDALAAAGARVILVGSSDEAELTRAVEGGMRRAAVDLAGALGLGTLKALIEKTQVLIANDAGCRHIAAAFGVPSLIFFGSTSVEKTPLNLEAVRVFERTLECRPCYKRECPRPGHPCLSEILPGPVSEAALQALGGGSQSSSQPERR